MSLGRAASGVSVVVFLAVSALVTAAAAGPQSAPERGGSGPGAPLRVIVEPSRLGSATGMQPVYSFVVSARRSLDMTMYELADSKMESDLVADARRGVKVRVILDTNREQSRNMAAFDTLRAGGVKVVWADTSYEATHQKTISVDDATSLILTGNLTSEYYTTTRDFGVFDSNPSDVAAIESGFDADFAHRLVTPSEGADLVWSPGATSHMLAVINGATHTLSIENEEMGDFAISSAIAAAARRGVRVDVTMTADSSYDADLDDIVKAGGQVHLYADESSDLYIHAKATVADAGLASERVYVGSINFSESLDGRQPGARHYHGQFHGRSRHQRRRGQRLHELLGCDRLPELRLITRWPKKSARGHDARPDEPGPRPGPQRTKSRRSRLARRHDPRGIDGQRPSAPGLAGDAALPTGTISRTARGRPSPGLSTSSRHARSQADSPSSASPPASGWLCSRPTGRSGTWPISGPCSTGA